MRDWIQKVLPWILVTAFVAFFVLKLLMAGPVEPEHDLPTLIFRMLVAVAAIVFGIWLLRRWK